MRCSSIAWGSKSPSVLSEFERHQIGPTDGSPEEQESQGVWQQRSVVSDRRSAALFQCPYPLHTTESLKRISNENTTVPPENRLLALTLARNDLTELHGSPME